MFNEDKKNNHLTLNMTCGRDFKGLAPVSNPCLVTSEDILDVPQELRSFQE